MRIRNALLAAAALPALATFGVMQATAQDAAPAGDAAIHNKVNSVEHPFRTAGSVIPRAVSADGAAPRRAGGKTPRHLVFLALPGGTAGGKYPVLASGLGVVILDADHDYGFVKRITWDFPAAQEVPDVTGNTASVATNMYYVETRRNIIAIDLATDKVAWQQDLSDPSKHIPTAGQGVCCERGEITPDGKTLIVNANHGHWLNLIDAATGKLKGTIQTPKTIWTHNMGLSPDGKLAFNASSTDPVMTVSDVQTMQPLRTITFSDAVRPFVVNHDGSRIYANVDNLLGFEIGDTQTGKVLKRVEAPASLWKAKWADPNLHFYGHGCPSHGIALTNDESELWVADNINDTMLVYDNTGELPVLNPKKGFKTTDGADWITMGVDGKRAYLASGDVADVKTHAIIGHMKDEYGRTLYSEKYLELAVLDGKMVGAESQFGQGVPAAYEARIANKQASN